MKSVKFMIILAAICWLAPMVLAKYDFYVHKIKYCDNELHNVGRDICKYCCNSYKRIVDPTAPANKCRCSSFSRPNLWEAPIGMRKMAEFLRRS